MEAMLLRPAGKDYLWGGTRLKTEYGKDLNMESLAETWECSTHKDGLSIVENGKFAGKSLLEVLRMNPEMMGRKHRGKGELPILIKMIDATQDLSIQVHPNDEYAWEYEGQPGKTELWYILDAKADAKLVYGFEHEVTRELLDNAVKTGEIIKHLHRIPALTGDVFYIPAGIIHAVGAGTLLVEIQQNSNVTYRVYDYNRIDKNGNKRELHFEKAVQVMDMRASEEMHSRSRVLYYYPGYSKEQLLRCEYFEVEKIQVTGTFELSMNEDSFQVLLCLEGSGTLTSSESEETLRLIKGRCIYLPASTSVYNVSGKVTALKIRS